MRLCLLPPKLYWKQVSWSLIYWSNIDSIAQSLNLLLNSPSTKNISYPYTYLAMYFINNPPMRDWQPLYQWWLFLLREPSLDLEKASFENLKLVWNGYLGFIVFTTPTTIQVIKEVFLCIDLNKETIICFGLIIEPKHVVLIGTPRWFLSNECTNISFNSIKILFLFILFYALQALFWDFIKYRWWVSLKCKEKRIYYQMDNSLASISFCIIASPSSYLPLIVVSLNFIYDSFV